MPVSATIPTGQRILDLFFTLLNSELGRTKEQLRRAVPGYGGLSEDAFASKFELDKKRLREIGIQVVAVPGSGGDRYRIGPDSFIDEDVHLDQTETALVTLAVAAWGRPGDVAPEVVLNKVRAVSDTVSQSLNGLTHLNLAGAGAAAAVVQAVRERKPIIFQYATVRGLEERSLEPWRLVVRGRALYVYGYDLDDDEPRTFRLSRIRSEVEVFGDPGDVTVPADVRARDAFSRPPLRPRLLVRRGRAPHVRMRALSTRPRGDGWDEVEAEEDEYGAWLTLIFHNVADVVVLAPVELRREVLSRLRAAAAFGAGEADADA